MKPNGGASGRVLEKSKKGDTPFPLAKKYCFNLVTIDILCQTNNRIGFELALHHPTVVTSVASVTLTTSQTRARRDDVSSHAAVEAEEVEPAQLAGEDSDPAGFDQWKSGQMSIASRFTRI